MICDVCNSTTDGKHGTRISSARFQELLNKGFGIDETNIEIITAGGHISRDEAIELIKQQYAASSSAWLLCPECAAKAKQTERAAKKASGTGCLLLLLLAPLAGIAYYFIA
jgi:hypothetical protein